MENGANISEARAAKAVMLERASSTPQINGVGLVRVGAGYGVKVTLSEPLKAEAGLPEEINGVPIIVDCVGNIAHRSTV